MEKIISFKWSLITLSIVLISISALAVSLSHRRDHAPHNPLNRVPASGAVVPAPESEPEAHLPTPARLKIPKIGVDAAITNVGVTSQGAMDVPKGPNDVAWFDLGPRPGEKGSAVIAGHFGWKNNIPAVFDDLHVLQKGDAIYIEDATGAMKTFVVSSLRTYGDTEEAPDVFASSDGKAHLNLITCEGVWNKDTKSYSGRLVVFAVQT